MKTSLSAVDTGSRTGSATKHPLEKQGLKCFGQSGVSDIKKELHQLVTMDELDPDNPEDINRDYQRAAMAYLMSLKEKQDGTIKA